MAYRSAHIDREKRAPDAGIVTDMVRQFADKHAFLRELVQNGIDAGATRIDVQIDRDDGGIVRTSVTDDGAGMSRAIIEGPLLTLFSSSKEGDSSKIGKYGIGFVSVFALEPDHVDVVTSNGSEGWLLRLFGDHTWELSEAAPAKGTTVTLEQPMAVDEFDAHARLAEEALAKWCRHARIPIDLVVLDAGNPAGTKRIAIQQPFSAPGLVSVIFEADGERIVASAGTAGDKASGGTFLGYYNRGLTLFETTQTEPGLGGVRVKIDSPKLSHTLSRDGIVRDREHARLLKRAADVVSERLLPELLARIARAAEEATTSEEYTPFLAGLDALAFSRFGKYPKVVLPLVNPIDGRRTMKHREIAAASPDGFLFAEEPSRVTTALAKRGVPVARWLVNAGPLYGMNGGAYEHVRVLAYVGPADAHEEDAALEQAMARLMTKIGKSCAAAQMARFEGALDSQPYRVTAEREDVTAHDKVEHRWGRTAILQLNVEDAAVRLARRRAKSDPVVAAHLLCRALLLADGALSAKLVDQLLEASLG